jgi:hypothetical protein
MFKMKKSKYILSILCIAIVAVLASCTEIDNYDAPDGTLSGSVIDKITGKPIITEQPQGFRIKYDEISWSDAPISQYFWGKADGTFNNSKLFAGKYAITPVEGAFVTPDTKTVDITSGGVTTVDFTVTPYISFNGVSIVKSGANVVATFTLIKNVPTSSPKDYRVFVTDKTPFVGNVVFESALSSKETSLADTDFGVAKVVVLDKLNAGKKYFIRIGARCVNPAGRYNFSEIVAVQM